MQVPIHIAKAQLSKLIKAALAGEEVVIARGREPVVKLVAIPSKAFKIGLLKDRLKGPGPDFFEPMEENDVKLWEGSV